MAREVWGEKRLQRAFPMPGDDCGWCGGGGGGTTCTPGDDGANDPGPMGKHIGKMPFMGGRGIDVVHMQGGHARARMPAKPDNADCAHGSESKQFHRGPARHGGLVGLVGVLTY